MPSIHETNSKVVLMMKKRQCMDFTVDIDRFSLFQSNI